MNSIGTDIESIETQKSVGKILRQARQKHHVRDLNIIASDLCIKPYLLEALELDDFASFPSSCYATGFLKNYSNYLGLNTSEVIALYENEYTGSAQGVVLSFPEAEKYNSFPIKSVAGIAMICVALFFGVWTSYDRLDAEETLKLLAPISLQSESTPVEFNESNATAISEASDEVRLKASEDVWVRISEEDGTVLVDKILAKGENLIAPKPLGLNLMTNNAGALSIFVGEKEVVSLGADGEILENVVLEQEKLLKLSMLR